MSAEKVVVSADALYRTLSTSLWVGAASPKYSYMQTGSVIGLYANLAATPNFTFTEEALMDNFGTRPEDAPMLLAIFGGPQGLAGLTYAISTQILPIAPHPTNTSAVLPLYILFTILTSLVIVLRMWSRHVVAGAIRSFDWLALVGFVMTVIWGGIAVYHSGLSGGFAAFYDRSWDSIRKGYEAYFILQAIYPFVIMAIKMSLLMFYFRMTTWNYMRYSVLATGLIVTGNTIAAFLVWMFQCSHVDYWNHQFEQSCRIDPQAAIVAISAIYIATDVVIWILPMPLVFKLQLYPRERILAVFTFSLGAIACVASCMRLYAVTKYTVYTEQNSSSLQITAWTVVELNLALICASAPAVRALVNHYAPKLVSSRGSSSDGSMGPSEKIHSRHASVASTGNDSNKSLDSNMKLGLETTVTAQPGSFDPNNSPDFDQRRSTFVERVV